MTTRLLKYEILLILLVLLIGGCASFRSGIGGEFQGMKKANFGAEKVKVLFLFRIACVRCIFDESCSLRLEHKASDRLHLKLNINEIPIA